MSKRTNSEKTALPVVSTTPEKDDRFANPNELEYFPTFEECVKVRVFDGKKKQKVRRGLGGP